MNDKEIELSQHKAMFTEIFARYNRGEYAREHLIDSLYAAEILVSTQYNYREGASVWFKFSESDCLATTINNIENDLDSPTNHDFMIDCFVDCVKNDSLRVFYS